MQYGQKYNCYIFLDFVRKVCNIYYYEGNYIKGIYNKIIYIGLKNVGLSYYILKKIIN